MAVDSVAGIPAEEHCILRTAAAEVDPLSEVAACKALRPAEEHHIHHTDCYRFVAAEMVVVSVVVAAAADFVIHNKRVRIGLPAELHKRVVVAVEEPLEVAVGHMYY